MRKIFVILIASCAAYTSVAQDGHHFVSKNFFRSDVFTGSFSGFLQHLINDPNIADKKMQKRTDSTGFSFSGDIKNFNPFFFKPRKLTVQLNEIPVQYGDPLINDTVFAYGIIAFVNADAAGERDVKKEFEKLHRQFNKKFFRSNFQDITEGDLVTGGLHNYFVSYSHLSPVTMAWGKLENDYVLEITLRLKSSANKAVLAASLYSPK